LDLLREAIAERLHELSANGDGAAAAGATRIRRRLHLGADAGKFRAQLYARNVVVAEQASESGGWLLDVDIWEDEWAALVPGDVCTIEEHIPLNAVSNA
jgi:hypothetical protein